MRIFSSAWSFHLRPLPELSLNKASGITVSRLSPIGPVPSTELTSTTDMVVTRVTVSMQMQKVTRKMESGLLIARFTTWMSRCLPMQMFITN